MPQIINETTLGGNLGTAFGQGLQLLAEHKANEFAQRQAGNQLTNAYKALYSPTSSADEKIAALTYLPEKERQTFFEKGGSELFAQPKLQPKQQGKQFTQEQGMFQNLQQPQNQGQVRTPSILELLQAAAGKQLTPQQFMPQGTQPQQEQQVMQPEMQQAPQQAQATQQKPITYADIQARPTSKQLEAQQRQAETHQRRIDTVNKPYLATLDKAQPIGEAMVDKGLEMLNLINSKQVTSGIGGLVPYIALNDASQQFVNKSNDVASLLASNSGVATNFKIKLAQERKPNLRQTPTVQRHATEDLIKDGQKITLRAKVRDDLIKENGGEQPANLQTKVNERFNALMKSPPPALPKGSQEGDMYLDEDTGRYWFVRNGKLI